MSTFREVMGRTRRDNLLYSALLELTYQCNLDCFFCYNDLSMHGKRMQFDDYTRLLDELADMNVMGLSLSGGEPLAWPHFFELGAYARKLGFVVTVKTNGHSVGPRLAARLREEVDPFLIETSLHGSTAETHDRQTRMPGSFARLVKNIPAMLGEGMRVRVNSTLTAWNEAEIAEMYALTDRLGCSLQFDTDVSPRDDGDREPLAIQASDAGIARLMQIGMQRAAAGDAQADKTASLPVRLPGEQAPDPERRKNCAAGSTFATIDPFGNVYPCVQFRRKVGNVHEQGIAEIWAQSNALTEIRELSFAANEVRLANGFTDFCPGLAELSTGDPLGVYPDIARKSRIQSEVFQGGKPTE